MSSEVIIVESRNKTPEAEVAQRIAPLIKKGYRVVSAQTSIATVGLRDTDGDEGRFLGVARHVYYVTTIVLEIPRPHPSELRLPG